MNEYIVYVKINENGYITAINSSAFLSSFDGWVEIDSGTGDKYYHAQGNYFDKPIYDVRGIMQYKLVDGRPVERMQEEMDADYIPPVLQPDPMERIAALEEQLAAYEAAYKEGVQNA